MDRIDRDRLEEFLWSGASSIFLQEAAVRLIIRHGYWLGDSEFLRYVEFFPGDPDSAGIHWQDALDALDRGDFKVDEEDANILRLAGSIATGYRVTIGWLVETLSRDAVKHFAEAVLYADGILEAKVTIGDL
jgi:hypothetical protein